MAYQRYQLVSQLKESISVKSETAWRNENIPAEKSASSGRRPKAAAQSGV